MSKFVSVAPSSNEPARVHFVRHAPPSTVASRPDRRSRSLRDLPCYPGSAIFPISHASILSAA
jgi:hypothetical protein